MRKDSELQSRFEDFAQSVELSVTEFAERWAAGFFAFEGTQLAGAGETTSTGMIKVADIQAMLSAKSEYARKFVATSVVFPVKHGGRSVTTAFISIGRTQNNDVVLQDRSVSGFHALITDDDEGIRRLQDAGSTNGTFIDEVPVPGRDAKEGAPLLSGAKVRIGGLELMYYDAEEFMVAVREVVRP